MEAFKLATVDWINDIWKDLFSDSLKGRLMKPILDIVIENNLNNPVLDMLLNSFVKDGKFQIDSLIDKYKKEFSSEFNSDGIKFKWSDIHPSLKVLSDKTNVITRDDINKLKDYYNKYSK